MKGTKEEWLMLNLIKSDQNRTKKHREPDVACKKGTAGRNNIEGTAGHWVRSTVKGCWNDFVFGEKKMMGCFFFSEAEHYSGDTWNIFGFMAHFLLKKYEVSVVIQFNNWNLVW